MLQRASAILATGDPVNIYLVLEADGLTTVRRRPGIRAAERARLSLSVGSWGMDTEPADLLSERLIDIKLTSRP